jgi:ABC-2 type transport system permease protein
MAGLAVVYWKELTDHFNSKRFIILLVLVALASILTIFFAAREIRSVTSVDTQFIFIRMFIITGSSPFSFPQFLFLFIPIVGIALGFDAINSERSSLNLSRVLAQPIYRDAVINGKFLAGVTTMAVLILATVLIIAGLGLRMIGVPPNAEEILRLFIFVILSVIYGAFWVAISILFSIIFRRTASTVLVLIAIWILFVILWGFLAGAIANAIAPVDTNPDRYIQILQGINRISPVTHYQEGFQVILIPEISDLSPEVSAVFANILSSGMEVNPLTLGRSFILLFPQMVMLIAFSALCFAISYIKFMREEIRST